MISPIVESDLPRIMEIERLSYPTPWSERMFLQEFSNPLGIAFGYRENSAELIGYIFGWMIFEDLHINNIAVIPDHRRRGIGATLLDALLSDVESKDAERVTLEVRPSNFNAAALYAKFGFTQISVRPGYYSDTLEDGITLGLKLPRTSIDK